MKYVYAIAILLGLCLIAATTARAATILFPSGGGTGISTTPTYGKLLVGNASGTYTLTASSSLGFLTTDVAEGTNQYFTQSRARSSISLTTTGSSGAATYNSGTGVLNIPQYTGGTGGSGNVATSTTETAGNLAYWTSSGATPATLGKVASSSLSSGSGISFTGTPGALVGGSSLTITNSGVISNSCPGGFLSCSGTNPSSFTLGTLGYGNGGTGTTTAVQGWLRYMGATSDQGVATSSLAVSSSFSYSGSLGALVGGTGGTLSIANGGIANAMLANSAISGISLGANLANLSATDSTLTFSGSYNGGTARTIGLNLGNANNWTSTIALGSSTPWGLLSVNPSGITGPAFVVGSSSATSFIVDNGGNVGIGTAAPTSKLYVNGDITSNSGSGTNTLTIRDGQISKTAGSSFSFSTGATTVATTQANGWTVGSGTNGLYAPGSTDLQLFANGTNLLKLTSGGVVGVASTTPSPLFGFDVATTTYFATTTTIGSQLNLGAYISNDAYINLPSNGALVLNVPGQTPQFRLLPNGTDIYFQNTNSSGNIQFTGLSGNPLSGNVIFNLTGKLGIGTTTPGSLLSLNNIANFTTATSTFYSTGGINLTGGGCFAVNGTCVGGGSGTNYFSNSGASTYLSTGTNLGVGTTSPLALLSVGMASTTKSFWVGVAGSSSPAFVVDSANNGGRIGVGSSTPNWFVSIDGKNGLADTAKSIVSITAPAGIGAPYIEGRDSSGAQVWAINQFGNVVAGTYQGTGANLTTSAPATSILNISTSFGGGQTGNAITIAVNGGATLDVFDKWGRLGVGTSSTPWMGDFATSSVGTQFNGGQLALTDTNAALNKKHWVFASEGGNFYLSTSTDLFATTTLPAFSVLSTGFVGIATANPTNWLTLPAGLVSLPSLSFGDATTGLFRSATNAIGIAINGVEKFTFASTGFFGISSTTPFAQFSVNSQAASWGLAIGSSTGNLFSVTDYGQVVLNEQRPATTTTYTFDWTKTGNQTLYQTGTAATTISFVNATTTLYAGSRKMLMVCNPGSTAGAITWNGVFWMTAPTQTTTAGKCDLYSFFVSAATSTSASPTYSVFGAQSTIQ